MKIPLNDTRIQLREARYVFRLDTEDLSTLLEKIDLSRMTRSLDGIRSTLKGNIYGALERLGGDPYKKINPVLAYFQRKFYPRSFPLNKMSIPDSKFKRHYFHSSPTEAPIMMNPRVPTKFGEEEDETTNRVCVTNSIGQCVWASPAASKSEKMFIHVPRNMKQIRNYSTHDDTRKDKKVKYPNFTGEYWAHDPYETMVIGEVIRKNKESKFPDTFVPYEKPKVKGEYTPEEEESFKSWDWRNHYQSGDFYSPESIASNPETAEIRKDKTDNKKSIYGHSVGGDDPDGDIGKKFIDIGKAPYVPPMNIRAFHHEPNEEKYVKGTLDGLSEVFNIIGLDTHKYTVEYLAEQLGIDISDL